MNHSESGNCLDRCPIRLNLNSNNNNEVSPAETAGWDGSSSFFKIESKPSGIVQFDEIVSLKDPGDGLIELVTYELTTGQKRIRRKRIVVLNSDSTLRDEFIKYIQTPKSPPHHPSSVLTTQGKRNFLIVVNPFSGQKRAAQLWKTEAEPVFVEAGISFEVRYTRFPKDGMQIAKELALDDYEGVALVSGDGLVSEFIQGLVERTDRERALKFPILHIPGGTGNGLAASVAYCANEPFPPRGCFCKEMALMAVRPWYLPLRVYLSTFRSPNGEIEQRSMFMSLSWGLIADIDLGSERFRWAGMIRYHIEAVIRIIQLSSVARYKAKISYLPVRDTALMKELKLKTTDPIGEDHFEYDRISEYDPEKDRHKQVPSTDGSGLQGNQSSSLADSFAGSQLLEVPDLDEQVPADWETIESEFVFVLLTSTSHLGSDLPYLPCARLDEAPFYLTFVDWNNLKSRFHMAHLLLSIDTCFHLDHECLRTIPVMACRVEPAADAGGYVALDGEACQSGSTIQVVSTSHRATLIGRQRRAR